MKDFKNIFSALVFVAALFFVFSNRAGAQKAAIGIRLMPTFSSFDLKTSSGGTVEGKVNLGFGIGALVGYNFSEHIGAQVEVIYSSISQKYTEQDVEQKVNLRYFNIPLLASFNTGRTRGVNFNLVAGPQIGIRAGAELSTEGDNTAALDPVLSVKKSDLGLAYGAGMDFGLNPEGTFRLGLGYRGVLGLIDISDNSDTIADEAYYILEKTNIKTNAIYAGISILF